MAVYKEKPMVAQPHDEHPAPGIPLLAFAVRDALTPSRAVPCPVDGANVEKVFRYATAICLEARPKEDGKAPPKAETFFDKPKLPPGFLMRLEDRSLVGSRVVANLPNLLIAVNMIGTHGGKVPDTRSGPAAVVASSAALQAGGDIVGMHGGNVAIGHPLSGAGNAAQSPQLRFLCMGLSFTDGSVESMASFLSGGRPELDVLIETLGTQASRAIQQIGTACRARLSAEGKAPTSIDPQRAQVLFPLNDDDYLSISPLYNYCLGAELYARIQRRVWAADESQRQKLDQRPVHVGGTKPANSGLVGTYIGGRFPRLLAMPPREYSFQAAVLIRRFLESGLSVSDGDISQEAVDIFFTKAAAHEIRPNAQTRDAMLAALGALCDGALSNLSLISRENGIALASGRPPLVPPETDVPQRSRDIALILGLIEDKDEEVDDRFLSRIASSVAAQVRERLHNRRPQAGRGPFVVDEAFDAMTRGIALQKLGEFV